MLTSVLSASRRAQRRATVDQQAGTRNKAAQQGTVRTGQWESPRRSRGRDAAILDNMPVEWRETLLLVVLENLTYVQTAECLGITLNTVIANLAHAREHLGRKQSGATPARLGPQPRAVPYLRVVK